MKAIVAIELCPYCEEEIRPDDLRGLHTMVNHHYECSIRMFGSLSHLRGVCKCFVGGSELHDDPKVSVRENAKLACREFHRQREQTN